MKEVLWIKTTMAVKMTEFCQGASRLGCFIQKGQSGAKCGSKAGRGSGGGGSPTAPKQGKQGGPGEGNLVRPKFFGQRASPL